MGDGYDEGSKVIGVALEVIGGLEHFKFNHMSVHAVGVGGF